MWRKRVWALALAIGATSPLLAQSGRINGSVKATNGSAIVGTRVLNFHPLPASALIANPNFTPSTGD